MAVAIIADVHIKLGQKNVPEQWQRARLSALAKKINELQPEYLIIAGDLLDVADPSIKEIGLMYDFLSSIEVPMVLIPGNHEMVSKTEDCFSYIERMLNDLNVKVIREFETYLGIDYIPYGILHKEWPTKQSNICVTHVRGEIPPHVKPEIDLDRFAEYALVIAGDLHSYKNSQKNIAYPGSPFTTSFHRNKTSGSNGLFLLNADESIEWVELDLPQLIRSRVSDPAKMIPTSPDHTIYELEGSLEELKQVKNQELLDKKVVNNFSVDATLNMTGNVFEELEEYLRMVHSIDNPSEYITLMENLRNE